jgi:hypothetical protein
LPRDVFSRPSRFAWTECPEIVIATTEEKRVKSHRCYADAKSGDPLAAAVLVRDICDADYLARLASVFDFARKPCVAAVHAEEAFGRNQIAQALSTFIANQFDIDIESNIVQANIVNHTGANGFERLASQALFEGEVDRERSYIMVDDFIGQGGTLANFRGHITSLGGVVLGGTALTGKPFSAKIALAVQTLAALRDKHGSSLEDWWQERFGFGFDCLTESEARYLINSPDAYTIRDRIVEAGQT